MYKNRPRRPARHDPYPPVGDYYPPPPRRRLPLEVIGIAFLSLAALVLTPLALVFGTYAYYQVFEPVVPGVRVGNLDVSGMRISEAARAIDAYFNLERPLAVSDGFTTVSALPAELGLSVDDYQTAQNAYEVGREGDFWTALSQMIASMRQGTPVSPVVAFDPAAAQAGLQALDAQIGQPPVNATVALQGGNLVTLPSRLGYAINIEQTMIALADNPERVVASGYLTVTLKPSPPQVNDATPMLAEAERFLSAGARIDLYDPISDEHLEIPVPREQLGAWLKVEMGESGPVIAVEASQVEAFMVAQSGQLGEGRYLEASKYSAQAAQAISKGKKGTAIVSHKPTTYQVRSGDTLLKISWKLGFPMWALLEANPDLDPERVLVGSLLNVPSKDVLLPLPVIPDKRIVMSIAKQRLWATQDGKELHRFVISTGIDRSPTQPGVFQVQVHRKNAYASVWDLYMPNFLGIYEAWPGFMNGIHGLPTLSNGTRLWASILGRPASYGCIILDLDDAKWLYGWAEDGVVVEIRP